MFYIALLRGINVGGKNKIDMKLLKAAFERAGMESVMTYINSGNIIFINNKLKKSVISKVLQDAIYDNFELQINVLVYSCKDYEKIAQSVPAFWTNDQQMKSDVLFLWEEIDDESVLEKIIIKSEIDTVKYVPGAIVWSVDRKNVTKSGMLKLAGSELYQRMTVRNVNTVRKLYDFIKKAEKKI